MEDIRKSFETHKSAFPQKTVNKGSDWPLLIKIAPVLQQAADSATSD